MKTRVRPYFSRFPFFKYQASKADFLNSTTSLVPYDTLEWPRPLVDRWKGLLGQRQIKALP
jgi:hypothetical protein